MRRERVAGSRRGWRTGVALVVVAAFVAIGAPPPAGAAPASTVVNTGRSGWEVQQVAGDLVVFTTSEFREQADLNGDGDTSDSVPVVWDRATGVTTTLPFAVYAFSTPPNGPPNFDADDQVVAFAVNESAQGATDLNGDGDAGDKVVHVWQRATGATTNLAMAVSADNFPAVAAGAVMLAVDEPTQGATDLNGDGDTFDDIVHIWTAQGGVTNLGQAHFGSTGEVFTDNGRFGYTLDISPIVKLRTAVVHDSATGTTATSLATLTTALSGGWAFLGANEPSNDADLNGDGDKNDSVAHVWDGTATPAVNLGLTNPTNIYPGGAGVFVFGAPESATGDLNGDGDTTDVVAHVWSPTTGLVNLGVVGPGIVLGGGLERPFGGGGVVAFLVPESQQGGTDLNGDGDTGDEVLHAWSPATGLVNTATASTFHGPDAVRSGIATWRVSEAAQGNNDLNGDGDTTDHVLHTWTAVGGTRNTGYAVAAPAEVGGDFVVVAASESGQQTDLDGDGSITNIRVPLLVEPVSGEASLVPYPADAVAAGGTLAAIWVSEPQLGDLNGDGDATDLVVHAVTVDANPPPIVSVGEAKVVEGDSGEARNVQFAVTLSEPATSEASVDYTLVPASASAPDDFNDRNGVTKTLRFKPSAGTGLTATTKYVTAKVTADLAVEGDEAFDIVLSNPVGLVLGDGSAAATIIDDDPGVGLRVSVGDASIWEGDQGKTAKATNNAKVWVNLSEPAASQTTVTVTVASGTATAGADFKKAYTKTLTFKPGQWQKAVAIAVNPDVVGEADETVTVTLSDPGAGLTLGRAIGTVTILDDD